MADPVFDAVIVGGGAGGGASAWALTRAGARVLLLEAGPHYDPARDYRLHLPDWEHYGFPERSRHRGVYTFAPMQALETRWDSLRSRSHLFGPSNPGPRRIGRVYQHQRGVGGATLIFSGEAHRLHPAAMRMRRDHGVGADWPFGYAELEPFYEVAERVVGVAGPAAVPGRPRRAPFPLSAHPMSHASRPVAAGCERLGLSWQANSLAILSRPYGGRPPCNYCGNCARGCPVTDKGSVDVTFIRQALATGRLTLRPDCEVLAIETGAGDRIAAVRYLDAGGAMHRVRGAAVVLAGGAVETPRLLLLSGEGGRPEGLANESGQVGRNFMETIAWTSNGLHPDPLGSHRGVPAGGICWDYNAPDAIPGVVGGCRFGLAMAESSLIGPVAYARRVVPGWGRGHKREMGDTFGRVLGIGAIGESLPNPGSYIDLDPATRTRPGLPAARIHSHLDETAIRRLAFMAKTSREILAASGVRTVIEETSSYDTFRSTHVFGTCRMGDDPETSVVDPHGRSHRWRNLFIVDASVFPSSGGGEAPSLTIEAVSLRTAGRLMDLARRGEV